MQSQCYKLYGKVIFIIIKSSIIKAKIQVFPFISLISDQISNFFLLFDLILILILIYIFEGIMPLTILNYVLKLSKVSLNLRDKKGWTQTTVIII